MSARQLKSLVLIPKFTAGLSMIGSSLVVWDILKERQTKLQKVYHRLLLVMSCMDIVLSFTLFLSTWPIPKDTPGAPWLAAGNDATCTAQGFTQVFFMPALFYNAYLAIYYVLVIVYGWHETRIAPLEKCAHVFTLVFSCVTAFTALALDMYGSNFLVWCFLTGSWNVQLMMNIAWQWAAWMIVFVMMLFLSWKIGKQFRTQEKYGEEALRASIVHDRHSTKRTSWIKRSWKEMSLKASLEGIQSRMSLARSSEFVSGRQASKRLSSKQQTMRLITSQAALYSLSYLLTESSNIAVSIAYYTSEPVGMVPIWVLQYALTTIPLQGFWNCLIYFRPRYLKWKEDKLKKMNSVRRTQSSTNHPNQRSSGTGGFTFGSSNLRDGAKESEPQCFDSTRDEKTSSPTTSTTIFQAFQEVSQMEDVDEAEMHYLIAQEISGGGSHDRDMCDVGPTNTNTNHPDLESLIEEAHIPTLQKQTSRTHQRIDEFKLAAVAEETNTEGLACVSSETQATPKSGDNDEAPAVEDGCSELSSNSFSFARHNDCNNESDAAGYVYKEDSVSSSSGDSQKAQAHSHPATTSETTLSWMQDKPPFERNPEPPKMDSVPVERTQMVDFDA